MGSSGSEPPASGAQAAGAAEPPRRASRSHRQPVGPARFNTAPVQPAFMQIEFDRDTCIGMFQCVAEWDAFEADEDAGKAVLTGGEEVDPDLFVREVPAEAELDAKFAARTCPVDAIRVVDDDGEQLVP